MLGHDAPPASLWTENLVTQERLERCPVRTIQLIAERSPRLAEEVDDYVDQLYPAYRDGHLLVAGGLSDQPARYVDLVTRIGLLEARVQARYLEITTKKDDGGGE